MSVLFLIQKRNVQKFTIYALLQLKEEIQEDLKRTEKCAQRQNRSTGLSESSE